jgi:zinc transport system permease protein
LVIALLTIPIYISAKLSSSLASMMIISGLLSSIFTLIGLYISYNYDITSGASIILTSAISLLIYLAIEKIKSNAR